MPSFRKDFKNLPCDLAEDILVYSAVKKKNQTAARSFYYQCMNRYLQIFCVACIMHNSSNSSCLLG